MAKQVKVTRTTWVTQTTRTTRTVRTDGDSQRPGPGVLPPRDGDWHKTKQRTDHTCQHCGSQVQDWPTVAYYRADKDDGDQGPMHPGWPMMKWLAWWQCPQCGWDTFEVVNEKQVRQWAKALDGWDKA